MSYSRRHLVPAKPPAVAELPETASPGTVVGLDGIAYIYNHDQWWETVPIVVSDEPPEGVPENTIWIGPTLDPATPDDEESATPDDPLEFVADPTLLMAGAGAPSDSEGLPYQYYLDIETRYVLQKQFESDMPPAGNGESPHNDNNQGGGATYAQRYQATSNLNVSQIGCHFKAVHYTEAVEVRYMLLNNNEETLSSANINIIGETNWVDIRTAENDPLDFFKIPLLSNVEIQAGQFFWIVFESRAIGTGNADALTTSTSDASVMIGDLVRPPGQVARSWSGLNFTSLSWNLTSYYAQFRLFMDGSYVWNEDPVLDFHSDTMGVVVHDEDDAVERPEGFEVVTWVGSVEPLNMGANDIWYTEIEDATPEEIDLSGHEDDDDHPHAAAGYIRGNFDRIIASAEEPESPSIGDVWIKIPTGEEAEEGATPNDFNFINFAIDSDNLDEGVPGVASHNWLGTLGQIPDGYSAFGYLTDWETIDDFGDQIDAAGVAVELDIEPNSSADACYFLRRDDLSGRRNLDLATTLGELVGASGVDVEAGIFMRASGYDSDSMGTGYYLAVKRYEPDTQIFEQHFAISIKKYVDGTLEWERELTEYGALLAQINNGLFAGMIGGIREGRISFRVNHTENLYIETVDESPIEDGDFGFYVKIPQVGDSFVGTVVFSDRVLFHLPHQGQLRLNSEGDLWVGAPEIEDARFAVTRDGDVKIKSPGSRVKSGLSLDGSYLEHIKLTRSMNNNASPVELTNTVSDNPLQSSFRVVVDGAIAFQTNAVQSRIYGMLQAQEIIYAQDGMTATSPNYRNHLKMVRGIQQGEFTLSSAITGGFNPGDEGIRVLHDGTLSTVMGPNGVHASGYFHSNDGIRLHTTRVMTDLANDTGTDSTGELAYGNDTGTGTGVLAIKRGSVCLVLNRTTTSTSSTAMLSGRYQGTQVGSVGISSTGVTFNETSDYRLKENLKPIEEPLTILSELNPLTFTWKDHPDVGPMQGFLAHEVGEVIPYAVTGEKDAVDEDGNIDPQGLDNSKLVPLLVAAVQQLKSKNDILETQVQKLLEKVDK